MTGIESVELYDIYGVWHVPFWQTTPFIISMWILAGSVMIAVLYLLYRVFIARKRIITPQEWALQELDALWDNRGFTRDDGKRFYSKLTEILKTYLEKQYGYNVRGATDPELISYLTEVEFSQELLSLLTRIIDGTQEIKFSDIDAIPEQMERDFDLSKSFIRKTIIQQDVA